MSLGLLGAYDSSSSSSSEDEEGGGEGSTPVQAAAASASAAAPFPKLANPFLASASKDSLKPSYMVEVEDMHVAGKNGISGNSSSSSSVFSNPFKAKEERKRAILEHHVTMTSKQEDQRTISGKKICWNFRKGRCRFGSKCTFAHDNDVGVTAAAAVASNGLGGEAAGSSEQQQAGVLSPPPPVVQLGVQPPDLEPDPSAVISHNKRKRPGLSDGLTPGKKAIKFHNKVYNKSQ